jgi:hypothetical protein
MGLQRTGRSMSRSVRRVASVAAVAASLGSVAGGCGSPSRANIDLRKSNAELQAQVDEMRRQRDADHAMIRGLQERTGALPTLPPDRLADLVTVGSIKVTKLTGGFDETRTGAADTGVRAYVRLFDTAGDVIKAAGTFTVEVFDLGDGEKPLIAKRSFTPAEANEHWTPMALVYSYVLPVPWQDGKPPKHEEVTVRVTYTDGLTQRTFTEQAVAKVKLSGAAGPTTGRSGS